MCSANQLLNVASLHGREIDVVIAKKLLGYKYCFIGPDANGENCCEILTPDGTLDCLRGLQLPPVGKVHEAYMVPNFHSDLYEAIGLWRRFSNEDIRFEGDLRTFPERMCKKILADLQIVQ